jgi:hypothetical protein
LEEKMTISAHELTAYTPKVQDGSAFAVLRDGWTLNIPGPDGATLHVAFEPRYGLSHRIGPADVMAAAIDRGTDRLDFVGSEQMEMIQTWVANNLAQIRMAFCLAEGMQQAVARLRKARA